MQLVLEILDGPLSGKTVEVARGQALTVGRTSKSQLMLPHDNFLSGMHFQVECGEDRCLLRDCNSSNGTWVNGARIQEYIIQDGDQVAAGQTRFRVKVLEGGTPGELDTRTRTTTFMFSAPKIAELEKAAVESVPLTSQQQALMRYLRALPAPLYGLLDAGVEQRIPELLIGSGEVFQYLQEAAAGADRPLPGFCLVSFPSNSQLLPRIVREGWGRGWITFLTSSHPFGDVRDHLRQFLVLFTADGRRMPSRFFDPRILQLYLPACPIQEARNLFGPVERYAVENMSDPSRLHEFTITPHGVNARIHGLS